MNPAYLHLIANHVPVLLIPFAGIVLFFAMRTGHQATLRFALVLFILAAASALPAYFSGEGAEDIVEKVAGVSEEAIEEHEDASVFALASSLIAGASAALALFLSGDKRKWALRLTLVLALWATTVLARTAYLGGFIIHHEAHGPAPAETAEPAD